MTRPELRKLDRIIQSIEKLAQATDDTLSSAELQECAHGLLKLYNIAKRDCATPGEKGIMPGSQWRITETGREVDGRGDAPTYEVTVWNDSNGDIVKKLWEATEDEVDDIRERYEDEPFHSVVVEERA
jgi:hypothetical protein